MLTKIKLFDYPTVEKNLSTIHCNPLPMGSIPDNILNLADFYIHYSYEEPFTRFYEITKINSDSIEVRNIGTLLHLGFACNDYHFEPTESKNSEIFFGVFFNGNLSFVANRHRTYYPQGKLFTPIQLSKLIVMGNLIPLEIKDKVEIVNTTITNELARLQIIQHTKNFKYGWIHYKLRDFMNTYEDKVKTLFSGERYFYFPQSPMFCDRHNCLPEIDLIKYTDA
tara:strand:+ start:401 stop:1072 length:672 start_codon:yes stop_codon:yes gene_type:complete